MKTFKEKPDLFSKIGDAVFNTVLWFLWLMTWVCFGIIAFAVVFQWVLLVFLPKEYYPYAMNIFITAWCIFGAWFWFFKMKEED